MFNDSVGRIFSIFAVIVALLALLKTDLLVRILSYGTARIADVPAWRIKLLRIGAGIMVLGVAIALVKYLRRLSDL
jgi:hypothetical protein